MACQLMCPNLRCRKLIRVPEASRGKIVRCLNCQCMLRIPPARLADPAALLAAPPAPRAEELRASVSRGAA
jgi:hypothetical protein